MQKGQAMNPFEELKNIANEAMLAVEEDDASTDVMAVIVSGYERAIKLAKIGLVARNETLVESCSDVSTFLKDLAKIYEQKTYSEILDNIGGKHKT